ncbi:MAG TPA: CGNR zinc finger domain-containing protein [Gaiellaceae bacterium]|nr:CGNR zinc finger domain-containing protein [Gaiellaceae bacterium]
MPRYDIPKAAPEPLRRVQLLVNSTDTENRREWIGEWLDENGLGESETGRAVLLREALRALVLKNNGVRLDDASVAALNESARRISPQLDAEGRLTLASDGDALDEVVAVALRAMLDGTWGRLKACRNCHWSFYDYSPNRSATWCSMQLCGNRTKTRAYRRRRSAV